MVLTRLFNTLIACCLLGNCLLSQAFANNKSDYAAVISFPNTDQAKWLIYNSYTNIAQIDKKVEKLITLSVDGLDRMKPPSERYYQDLKFQKDKFAIERAIDQNRVWIYVFDNEVSIDIYDDGEGNSMRIDLPKMDISDLGISDDELTSIDSANNSIGHLIAAKDKINTLLETDTIKKRALEPKEINNTKNWNHFYVSAIEESENILESLGVLHDLLMDKLNKMQVLANKAADGSLTRKERQMLNGEFQYLKEELSFALKVESKIGNIKRFNDNKLVLSSQRNTKEYLFTKLNLDLLDLKDNNILTLDNAWESLITLFQFRLWIIDWMIYGDEPLDEHYKNKSLLDVLPLLNLSDNEKEIIKKGLLQRTM